MGMQQIRPSLEFWQAGPEGGHLITAQAFGPGSGFQKKYITPAEMQAFVPLLLKVMKHKIVDGTLEVVDIQNLPEAWRVFVKAEELRAPDVTDTEDDEELKDNTHVDPANMPDVSDTEDEVELNDNRHVDPANMPDVLKRKEDELKAEKFADYLGWGCFGVVTAYMLLQKYLYG